MAYKVTLKKRAKVNGAVRAVGDEVKVSNKLFEELERRGLVAEHEEVEDVEEKNPNLPTYSKITEEAIRTQLDALGVDHSEAADKKAAYALLEAALKDGE